MTRAHDVVAVGRPRGYVPDDVARGWHEAAIVASRRSMGSCGQSNRAHLISVALSPQRRPH